MFYTIDEVLTVRVFNDGETVPFWLQPQYPNGDKFDNYAEAEVWAKLAVASYLPDEPFVPMGKGFVGEPKPTPEQIEEMKRARR